MVNIMKICHCVLLKLVLVNCLIHAVQSDWSFRKIFTDNVKSDGKEATKDASCKSLTAGSRSTDKGGVDEDDSYEYDYTVEGADEEEDTTRNKRGRIKKKRPNNTIADDGLIEKRIGLGRVFGEIKRIGRNNESYEIVLKPEKIKCFKNSCNKKNNRLRRKKVKHHRNKHCKQHHNNKCRNEVSSDHESCDTNLKKNKGNINNTGDYVYEDDKFCCQVGVDGCGHSEEDYEDEEEADKNEKEEYYVDDGNKNYNANGDEIVSKNIGLRHVSGTGSKIKGKERLKIFPPPRPDFGHSTKLWRKETRSLGLLTMAVGRRRSQPLKSNVASLSDLDSVKVNGSVEGIIVMSFNFSDDGVHFSNGTGDNYTLHHPSQVYTGVPLEKTNDNSKESETKVPEDSDCELYESEEKVMSKSKKSGPEYRSRFTNRKRDRKNIAFPGFSS